LLSLDASSCCHVALVMRPQHKLVKQLCFQSVSLSMLLTDLVSVVCRQKRALESSLVKSPPKPPSAPTEQENGAGSNLLCLGFVVNEQNLFALLILYDM